MAQEITAQQIIARIKNQLGVTWKDSPRDVFSAGRPETRVTGIVTSYTPSIEVLERSVAAEKNLIITQQPAFYQEDQEPLKNDPAYLFKKNFIDKNNLVLWRFDDNWASRQVDGQLLGLARSLGWDEYQIPGSRAVEQPYNQNNKYFRLPESSLRDRIIQIRNALKIRGIRVIGDPATPIKKAALSHGMFQFSELQEILKEPEVDLIVIAEAIEWESCEYFRDILTWRGQKKAMILLGRQAAEDPGYGEAASWLKTFIPEVPIEWIPTEEPFWIPEFSSAQDSRLPMEIQEKV